MHQIIRTRRLFFFASLTVFLFLSTLPGFCANKNQANSTEHVVLIIIDGLRYSEGLGDPSHTYVPEMWALAQQGAVIEPFNNDGITYTSRAIPAIWCGAWTEVSSFKDPDCGGQDNNYTALPTIFEYYRKQLSRPAEDCIYILKDVGCPWKASLHPEHGPDYWPFYHSIGSTDLDVWDEAKRLLETFTPSLSLIYLAEVDHAGHSEDWDYYTRSISTADSIVGLAWEFFQSHPHYAGKTTMFVTNDHGRHSNDFAGHGDNCDGCRRIQLLAVGPTIKKGLVSTIPRTLRDITPTIGELLGFTTDYATGTPLLELFYETSIEKKTKQSGAGIELDVAPNPFNPMTEIRFDLPVIANARIAIYNTSGSLVSELYQGRLPAGQHQFHWNAISSPNMPLPSGVYLVNLQAAGLSTTRQIVLLR